LISRLGDRLLIPSSRNGWNLASSFRGVIEDGHKDVDPSPARTWLLAVLVPSYSEQSVALSPKNPINCYAKPDRPFRPKVGSGKTLPSGAVFLGFELAGLPRSLGGWPI
jgi:hypothetical protein